MDLEDPEEPEDLEDPEGPAFSRSDSESQPLRF